MSSQSHLVSGASPPVTAISGHLERVHAAIAERMAEALELSNDRRAREWQRKAQANRYFGLREALCIVAQDDG